MRRIVAPHPLTRRQALQAAACGFGSLALTGLAGGAATDPHHVPRARRIVFIFMAGGPSHVDTFDYKPLLEREDGQMHEFADARLLARERKIAKHRVLKSPWRFQQYGQTGRWVSDLFPHVARHVDDLCLLHGMHTEGVAHGPATLFLHTGTTTQIRPSMGSWITYGLGTANDNLPAFVSLCPAMGNGGPRNYGSAFLPPVFQGTAIGRAGIPAREAQIRNLVNTLRPPEIQQLQFELISAVNAEQRARRGEDPELDAVIDSYELAFRMQHMAPEVLDLGRETAETHALYGIDEKATENFGRQCLMARRLLEAGVRYVQINYNDNTNNPAWDQHSNLPKHAEHAKACDQPIAALLTDLKRRGLLDDTLVWWGGEFGRNPYAEKNGTGRDHNPNGFTVWLAGGGVRPGITFGATDEFGHRAIENRVHMHDLHATLLYLLGLDHERLTYRHAGRNFRLTDVHGRVVHEIVA